MTQYIYIDESGDVGIGTDAPTGIDLDAIDNGILQVIAIVPEPDGKVHVYDIDGKAEPSALLPTAIAHDEGGAYHWIPAP